MEMSANGNEYIQSSKGFCEGGRNLTRPLTRVFVTTASTVFGLDEWYTISFNKS